MKTIFDLMECFAEAIENDANFFAVVIEIEGCDGKELIINPAENFEYKLDYYNRNYNEDLTLQFSKSVRIVDFTWGDTIEDIADSLEY